jgi:hypothetical protein
MVELNADTLKSYFAGRDLHVLIEQLKRKELADPISAQLSEGLAQILRERDSECFTLPNTWRFATRIQAARSRMPMLMSRGPYAVIVDASCGIGLMLKHLAALAPDELIGIEIDPVIAELARMNMSLFGIDARILTLDANSDEARTHITRADLVFCDPARTPSAPSRSIDEGEPSYSMLASHARRLVYEASPRIPIENLPSDTIELYSERRRHARTTLYHGFGMVDERRVVSDHNEEVSGAPRPFVNTDPGSGRSLELLDPTIVRAGLAYRFGSWHESSGKYLRLTDTAERGMFIDAYAIIARGDHATIKTHAQQISDFNRIALRYPVPAGAYWREANAIRKSGSGSRTIHVFKLSDELVLAEPMP